MSRDEAVAMLDWLAAQAGSALAQPSGRASADFAEFRGGAGGIGAPSRTGSQCTPSAKRSRRVLG